MKKKRVLLVDASSTKRSLRADVMRKLGIEVDCAADIGEARGWWRADLYNLVLMNVGDEQGRRDKFCEDVRSATPPQQLAFLVGKPEYLAKAPNGGQALQEDDDCRPGKKRDAALEGDPDRGHFGILQACRRISAVRFAFDARSRAARQTPEPLRDAEPRRSAEQLRASQLLGLNSAETY